MPYTLSTVDELADALGQMDVGRVASLMAVLPPDVFTEPCLRHRINERPHNRATAHALALESLHLAVRSNAQAAPERQLAAFQQGAAVCRLLIGEGAPVAIGHSFHAVAPDDTYATFLFLQTAWPECLVSELDILFDEYVAAGYIAVDRAFGRNHTALMLHLPLEAAVHFDNFHAMCALFRAGCSTERLGMREHGRKVELLQYVRDVAAKSRKDRVLAEKCVAKAMKAMMLGRLESTGRIHLERVQNRQRQRARV